MPGLAYLAFSAASGGSSQSLCLIACEWIPTGSFSSLRHPGNRYVFGVGAAAAVVLLGMTVWRAISPAKTQTRGGIWLYANGPAGFRSTSGVDHRLSSASASMNFRYVSSV